MLSDSVLLQLAKNSPLQQEFVEAAWPSIGSESKINLIDAMARANSCRIPAFLSDLALADPAEIVRFWAAQYTYFVRPVEGREKLAALFASISPEASRLFEVSDEDIQRSKRADDDPSALVRAAAHNPNYSLSTLNKLPRLARLLWLRSSIVEQSEQLAEFLVESLNRGEPRIAELREYLFEYFSSDAFNTAEFRFTGMQKLWKLAATAPSEIACVIASHAPLERRGVNAIRGFGLDQNFFVNLPDDVKSAVLRREGELAEQLRDSIRKNPSAASTMLNDAVKHYDSVAADYGGIDATERERLRLRTSPDRSGVLLDAVLRLENALASIRKEIIGMQKKRGFFGK